MTKNTHLKRRVLLALMSILLVLGIYAGSAISVHAGDLTIKKTTEDGKNGEFSFRVRLLNMRYAVAILGIGVDTLEDGSTAGLTFGPATGENYCSSYHSHTPSGKTTDGNAHRCVHDDTWQEILQWNQDDPWVYEQCVAEGCTHGINLYPKDPVYDETAQLIVTGDGGGALFDEIDHAYSRWNQQSGYTYRGWIVTAIRATLNGADSNTDSSNTDAKQVTPENCLLSWFPPELQEAIGARATKYDDWDYDIHGWATATCYDKLWLLSPNEIWSADQFDAYEKWEYAHPQEGTQYERFQGKVSHPNPSETGTNSFLTAYTPSEIHSASTYWLRSITRPAGSNPERIYLTGDISTNITSMKDGIAPCFSLDRSVTVSYSTENYLAQVDTLAPAVDEDNDGISDNGIYEFTIPSNDDVGLTIPDIPGGYLYEVWEKTKAGWELCYLNGHYNTEGTQDDDDDTTYAKYRNGIGKANQTVTFTNRATTEDLTITKTVDGPMADQNKEFNFTFYVNKSNSFSYTKTTASGTETGTISGNEGFTLAHGESLVIKDIPRQSSYKVTEEETQDYTASFSVTSGTNDPQPGSGNSAEGSLYNDTVLDFTNTCTIPPPVTGDPPVSVSKSIDGDTPAEDETFTFRMIPTDAEFPLPEESAVDGEGYAQVEIHGSGTAEFGDLVFAEAGVYEYTISEVDSGATGYTYDGNSYQVIYTVTLNDDKELVCERQMKKNGEEDADDCVFTNTYTDDDGDGDGDGNDNDDGDGNDDGDNGDNGDGDDNDDGDGNDNGDGDGDDPETVGDTPTANTPSDGTSSDNGASSNHRSSASADTGDNVHSALGVSLLILAALTGLYFRKRRRES